jgi:hypothetical protein
MECGQSTSYRFSVLVGTIFENTNVPLKTWFKVVYLMLTCKKSISALQVHRMMGFGSYRTAWYMCHRVRAGLANPEFRKLMGIVEVDETYIGGKNRNRHWDKRTEGTGGEGKETIIGAAERKGNIVARVIECADTETLNNFIREAISEKVSLIATDEHSGYRQLKKRKTVRHSAGQYVDGIVHTQTIDGQYKATVAALIGIGPKDEMEGMIAAQMLASHNAAMECYRRAMGDEVSFEGRQANLNQANKLVRSYAVLVEALSRHRGNVQRVQVEHVTVRAGGQAIVGTVDAQGIAKPIKSEERPHALGHGPSPKVRSKNEIQQEAVPIASNGKRQVLHARRNVAGGQKG